METDITFTNTSFSMRCGKCADIHNAQLEGKQSKSCECDCHEQPPQYIPYYPPYPPTWYYNGTSVCEVQH